MSEMHGNSEKISSPQSLAVTRQVESKLATPELQDAFLVVEITHLQSWPASPSSLPNPTTERLHNKLRTPASLILFPLFHEHETLSHYEIHIRAPSSITITSFKSKNIKKQRFLWFFCPMRVQDNESLPPFIQVSVNYITA